MMDEGFVKLWRKTKDSRVFRNEGLLKVWIWCLMKASHKKRWVSMKSGKGEIEIEILPGQFVFGRNSAGKSLHMKPETARTRIAKLEKMQNLTIEPTRQYSIVSITNWDTYQSIEKKDTIEDTNRTPGKHQPDTTNKNVNTLKNEENKDIPPLPPKGKNISKKDKFKIYLKSKIQETSFSKYETILCEFVDYRMSMIQKDQYKTEHGINGLLTSVGDLLRAGFDPEKYIKKCMDEGWKKPDPEYFKKKKKSYQTETDQIVHDQQDDYFTTRQNEQQEIKKSLPGLRKKTDDDLRKLSEDGDVGAFQILRERKVAI